MTTKPTLEPAYPGHDPRRRPMFTLGDYLRKALQVSGVSNQAMAEYLGVSRNTITNMITDRVPVKRQTLILWALRTGVALSWIEQQTYAEDDETDQLLEAYAMRDELSKGLETYDETGRRTRRDSNPKPSDWESDAQVIALDVWRVGREAVAS